MYIDQVSFTMSRQHVPNCETRPHTSPGPHTHAVPRNSDEAVAVGEDLVGPKGGRAT